MVVVILVYTVGSPDIYRIRVVRGVDQRFGRLDIVARIMDVLLDDAFKDVDKYLIVYIESIKMAVHIDVDAVDKRFYREVELYNILLRCINSSTTFCSKIEIDFELLLEMLQARYEIAVLSEEGNILFPDCIGVDTVYVVGTEEDPPKDVVARYRKISIGPLSYQADQVVSYLAWIIARGKSRRPDPSLGGLRPLSEATASPNVAGLTSGI